MNKKFILGIAVGFGLFYLASLVNWIIADHEWIWTGDTPGETHGPGDGWSHYHHDGRLWMHPEQSCPLDKERDLW